jgi:hypothetical protein
MKYIIIPYIALGLVSSLVIGIEYNCEGQEMFPTFFGSPFVFKKESLGNSMEYVYSISGIIINVLTWSVALFMVHSTINRLIQKFRKKRLIIMSYKVTIGIMIAFTTLNLTMDYLGIGHGFNKGLNYWYWNMDKEAEDWGMTCTGELIIFKI